MVKYASTAKQVCQKVIDGEFDTEQISYGGVAVTKPLIDIVNVVRS